MKLAFPAIAPRFAREAPARFAVDWKGDERDQHWRTDKLAECVSAVTLRFGEAIADAEGESHPSVAAIERSEKTIASTAQAAGIRQ